MGAKRKKLRPLGDILIEMEPLLLEMVEAHDLQYSDILGLVHSYLMVHCPGAREEYLDGSHPVLRYGPMEKK